MKYTKKYLPFEASVLLCAFVSVVFSLSIPVLTGQAVDLLTPGAGHVEMDKVLIASAKVLAAAIISAFFQYVMSRLGNRITYSVVRDIRNDAMDKIQKLKISYLDGHRTGDLLSRIIQDADTFADGLLMGFTQLFTGIMTILGTLIFMVRLNPFITLLVVPDQAVGGGDDPLAGTEILLHQKHPGPRMIGGEIQKCFGIRRPKAVNTLILISHHEKISLFPGKERDDRMLNLRGVLRLINTDIRIGFLKKRKHLRAGAQNGIGIGHLIIVIHQAVLPQIGTIPCVNVRHRQLPRFSALLFQIRLLLFF